jgi:acetyl-CoA C-acetyltransferase
MSNRDVFICAAARTPIGAFQGALQELTAPKLGTVAIQAALSRSGLGADDVAEVFMGCVLTGRAWARRPARQAARGSWACRPPRAGDDPRQGVRLGPAGGDPRRHGPCSRSAIRRGRGRGRHGVHEPTRRTCCRRLAQRLPHTARPRSWTHMIHDGLTNPVRRAGTMGNVRRALRARVQVLHARGAGRARGRRRCKPGPGGAGVHGDFAAEIAAVTVAGKKGEGRLRQRGRSRPSVRRSAKISDAASPRSRRTGTITAANAVVDRATARRRWCSRRATSCPRPRPDAAGPRSSGTARTRRRRSGSPRPRSAAVQKLPAPRTGLDGGRTWTCSRSTRRSRWSRWPR